MENELQTPSSTPAELLLTLGEQLNQINLPENRVHPLLTIAQELLRARKVQYFPQKEGQQIRFIPYKTQPLDQYRRRLEKVPPRRVFLVALPFLLIASGLMILSITMSYLTPAMPMLGFFFGCLNIPLCTVLFLLFCVRDVLYSDQFGLSCNGIQPIFWTDMESISIVDMPARGKHRFFLEIHGRSGSKFSLRIAHLYPESIEPLSMEIEKHAPFCRNVSQLSELKRFRDFENGELPGVTYPQLWESLTNKNIELTGFAPLQRGYALQEGRLKVLHQIASGGFSAVYLVENEDGAKFVLKEAILPFGVDQALAEKAAEQFEREAHILKALNHSQIARVYDFFVEHGRKYMLLEYLAGKTLKEMVYQAGPLPSDKVLGYSLQIAILLKFLHELPVPIVHRDIAPDNLIVTETGKVYLIDFGSANEFVGNATGTLVGKHAYMSPEQIRGKATPLSDIYSLGQTMYYCREGGAPSALKNSHLSKVETQLDKALDEVVRACTQLDAANRPESVAEVIKMLEAPFAVAGACRS